MLTRFKQKSVLITGGASGLGEQLVYQFAQLGWKIAVVDISLEKATTVAEKAHKMGAEVNVYYCDVGKDEDFVTIAEAIKKQWGGLDIIINNAGIASSGMMEEINNEEWYNVLNINLNSVYRGCHYWMPLLPENGPAHIVNTASFAGIMLEPSMMSYNVSKAGVIALSKTLRAEVGGRDIGVSVVCPAFFKTNLVESMTHASDAVKNQINKWMETSGVTAEDVAKDILNAIEKNRLFVVTHKIARRMMWMFRFFPNYMMKKAIERGHKIFQRKQQGKQTRKD
ncbi:MAG: SDR family NAD(P)-dependent oxidoreductase [Gammaproteobacteria bacterium]|nr:SDR family NAD(P)-dependent oxidoreductase [Gammaproteobacteria bacterium]MDH5630237.1 SDR family NAD(P)-dependent oxidoreductase [Gammaproteobacteria bacterium]